MKIGLVCPYDINKGGGVQEVIIALHAGLTKLGHQSRIITPVPQGYDGAQQKNVIFIGASRDFKSPFKTTGQISVSLNTDDISDVINREKFDVLNFHEPWVPVMSRQLLARSNSVNVATFHAKLPETMVAKTIEKVITPYTRSILRQLHTLSAVSDAAAEYVRSLTDEPVHIVPNGIDLNKYQRSEPRGQSLEKEAANSKLQTPNSKSSKTILYIGRLEKRKGVKYLLMAFQALAQEDSSLHLIIAGDGALRARLEEWVELNKVPRVKFLGFVKESQKLDLLAKADLFCSPALYGESFGIVLLEAMAMGLPTIAGNNPGYSAVLKAQSKLSLVDPKDTQDFARHMHHLLYDEAARNKWQTWARDYVQQFDYPKVVDQYEALYKQAIKK